MTEPATAATCVRRAGPALAVQCRKDNEAEVTAFLREVRGLCAARHYRANPYGGWQGIYDSKGLVEQVWVGSWLVALPEARPYVNLSDGMFRELYARCPMPSDTAAPLQPWAIVCPDGLPFRHYATEREAATVAAKIDVGGQMYPFHAMHCGPHTVEKVA